MTIWKSDQDQIDCLTEHHCHCPCHVPGSRIQHVMACCLACPHCDAAIKLARLGEHQIRCHTTIDDLDD